MILKASLKTRQCVQCIIQSLTHFVKSMREVKARVKQSPFSSVLQTPVDSSWKKLPWSYYIQSHLSHIFPSNNPNSLNEILKTCLVCLCFNLVATVLLVWSMCKVKHILNMCSSVYLMLMVSVSQMAFGSSHTMVSMAIQNLVKS